MIDECDIYALLHKSKRLLEQGALQVHIHGFGPYICIAINLVLQLKETSTQNLELSVSTSMIDITSDEHLMQLTDIRSKSVPAIHITLWISLIK